MENSQENTTFILADVKVFDFLKEKAGDRKTKTEAYWDLLDRSMAGFVSPFVRKVERKLLPNQCHVTISDLAEFWHWHRATVRTFLDALESFGLLERTKLNKSVIITMTVQSGKNAIAGTEQEEPDFATRIGSILSEWVIGKKTSEDAGHSCGQALCQCVANYHKSATKYQRQFSGFRQWHRYGIGRSRQTGRKTKGNNIRVYCQCRSPACVA